MVFKEKQYWIWSIVLSFVVVYGVLWFYHIPQALLVTIVMIVILSVAMWILHNKYKIK